MTRSLLNDADQKALLGKSKKEIGKSITGMPDEFDEKNIKSLIDSYELAHQGRLKRMATDYAIERSLSTRDKYGTVSKDSESRFVMWMPADLQQVLQKGYPSIWTNERHLHWFLKRFPVFRASEKL